jgi:hypothetical protein
MASTGYIKIIQFLAFIINSNECLIIFIVSAFHAAR